MYKKLLSVAVVACFIVMAAPVSESSLEQSREHTATFARLLPDGTIEYVEETVDVAPGEDLSAAVAERCAAMVEEDARFQHLMNQETGLYLIVSGGDGFHVALPPALFELRLLRISFNLIPGLIYCSYSDSEASTTITPLAGGDGVATYDGPHKIFAGGFVGVIGWSGIFSFTSTGFAGLTLFTWTSVGES